MSRQGGIQTYIPRSEVTQTALLRNGETSGARHSLGDERKLELYTLLPAHAAPPLESKFLILQKAHTVQICIHYAIEGVQRSISGCVDVIALMKTCWSVG
jgi:hypothetical protein